MQEIVISVKQVTDIIAEIALASQEQSVGIQQVNTAVMQMDSVVQRNASLVEESSAAAEAMRHQAESLLQLVSKFKLGNEYANLVSLRTQENAAGEKPQVSQSKFRRFPVALLPCG